MINYGLTKSFERPKSIEVTANAVFVASDIEPCVLDVNNQDVAGFQYNYRSYTKDEYMALQNEQITELAQQLEAAKILLGVD